MGVEMTRASSCSSHSLLGDTSLRALGRRDNRAGSGLIRDLPASSSQAGAGGAEGRVGSARGIPLGPRGTPCAGPAPAALPPGLTNLPNSGIAPRDPGLGKPSGLIALPQNSSAGYGDTEAGDLLTPKQRVPAKTVLGHPPRFSPPPSSRDLNANKAAALGAWQARPADAPCRSNTPALEGRGGGWGYVHPSLPHNTPPALPLPLTLDPGRTPRRAPRIGQHGDAPTPSSSQGGEAGAAGGVGAGGARGPGGAPPTLAHRERRGANGASAAAGRALPPGTARPGSGREPGFPGQPASSAERAGGGPRQGNPIPQHRPQSKPAPNFPSGVGEPGAVRGPGEDPGRRPDSTGDPPLPRAALPDQSAPPDAMAAGTACPAQEPPPGSPLGAQEGSRTNCCPRR